MIEVRGNLWTFPADIRVITTNGTIKKNGECVMGRGCAREAAKKYPVLPYMLGQAISSEGNVAMFFPMGDDNLVTLPVKHNWFERADIDLIERGARKIAGMNGLQNKVIVVPRPGCGNGSLRWEDVRPVIAPIFDDRFHVITF